jgi:hypothetical protein
MGHGDRFLLTRLVETQRPDNRTYRARLEMRSPREEELVTTARRVDPHPLDSSHYCSNLRSISITPKLVTASLTFSQGNGSHECS